MDIGENTFLKLREEKLRLKEELDQVKIQRDISLRKGKFVPCSQLGRLGIKFHGYFLTLSLIFKIFSSGMSISNLSIILNAINCLKIYYIHFKNYL